MLLLYKVYRIDLYKNLEHHFCFLLFCSFFDGCLSNKGSSEIVFIRQPAVFLWIDSLGFFEWHNVKNEQSQILWEDLVSLYVLTLKTPTSQNGQTHSSNSSAASCLSMLDHFLGL